MHPSAVVAGRCAADLLHAAIGLAFLVVTGFVLGWRPHGGLADTALALGLLLWFRVAMLWIGIYVGLVAKGPEAVTPVQILVWPIGFLSSVFLDPATMPAWLGSIAAWNPLSITGEAVRALFGNPGWAGGGWLADQSVPLAILVPAVLVAVFLPLSVRRFQALRG